MIVIKRSNTHTYSLYLYYTIHKTLHPFFKHSLLVMCIIAPRRQGALQKAVGFVKEELYIAKEFIKYDVTATLCQFAAIFSVAATYAPEGALLPKVLMLFLMWVPYTLAFTCPGQIFHIAEDAVNKPHRIMVRGYLNREQAMRRWFAYIVVYLVTSHHVGCGLKAAAWVLAGMLHYCTPVLRTEAGYVWKNALMSMGYYVLQTTAWTVAGAPQNGAVLSAVVLSCVVLFFTMQMQDLRDTEGDRLSGRKTFPVVVGDVAARRVSAFFLAVGAAVWLNVMIDVGGVCAMLDRVVFLVHSVVLVVGTFLGGREGRVYSLFCLWCMHLLFSFHFTDLSHGPNTVDLQGQIDLACLIAMICALGHLKAEKHMKEIRYGSDAFNWMTLFEC